MTMNRTLFHASAALLLLVPAAAAAADRATAPRQATPARGGALPPPLPLFPPDNWWNRDISAWPIDPGSSAFIGFINDGGPCRTLHPDFGPIWPAPPEIIGFPYVVVDELPLEAVQFVYSEESDGVDHATNTSFPFYPIPGQAITEPYWIEGGHPGNQQCGSSDRHMLIVDRNNRWLYELYDVCWTGGSWHAGSGAFFDMKTNNRRPEGWTSADAAGLAILPGLVRHDEAFGPSEIDHAFRFTVRATNGHVYPASHTAGSTPGALPMGARLRLRADKDISGELPYVQKIFRAMKKYGLIVADNGTDMSISGTHDLRWDNDELNPAFRRLTACDFEVVQLGHNPPPAAPAVTATSPAAGTQAGGTVVYVAGSAFNTGATVTFGGVPATDVTVLRSTTLLAVTGPHAPGPVDVVVRNADGQSGTRAGGYTYCAAAPPAPDLTAPSSVVVDATNVPASVPPAPSTVFVWSLRGGTITSGQGTAQVAFDAGTPGTTMRMAVEASTLGCSSAATARALQVDFLDAPPSHPFREFVNTVARNGVTGGCGGGRYCVATAVTRAQMAVFLLRARHGSGYAPPAATGTLFTDVPANGFAAAYIEQLVRDGVTGGCGTNPPRFCPNDPVTRAQMAVFLLRAKHGGSYVPPDPTGLFDDVPVTDPFARWIERLANDGVTGGCSQSPPLYCPGVAVARGEMAVFLTRNFALD
jgi:hypothetical protein